ncbi:hypothetical protein B9Z55_022170 [Caenorhabditis nigoni]|uniref:BZIP domain-containing protein n=2 Tax=Caenorhabditis nigoni TaxID=1611254 RepID=A0A2G5SJ53_9PELO|nr:hypothetical protein B9Z55_022170 [Caenorhabditis nigoni]
MFSKLNYSNQMNNNQPKPYSAMPMKNPQISRLQGEQIRGLTDLPDNGASTSAAGAFTRQDSLALAASFQQRDRERNPVDFMETELDLDNYLQCFTDLDVPVDNVDFDDAELQKVNILYDGERPYEPPVLNEYERHVAYGPGFRNAEDFDPDEYKMNCELKAEAEAAAERERRIIKRPSYNKYKDYSPDTSDLSDDDNDYYYNPNSKNRAGDGLANFKPQTKARKYNLKAADEKAQPTYKLKRARNNDAVRKSRNKAKELQKKREDEHEKMKKRIAELEGLLASEREARKRSEDLLETFLRNKAPKEQKVSGRLILETPSNYNRQH